MNPLAIDLFGCGGGMTLAMLMEGWRPVASVDYDERWTPTFAMNFASDDRVFSMFPEVPRLTRNLLTATPRQVAAELGINLNALRWVHGSPPCQDHSWDGDRKRTGDGHDGLLVPVKWAETCPNAYVTIENVVGVETSHRFPELLGRLRDMRRETLVYKVCSSWYGDPQYRERLWITSAPPGIPCPPVPPPTSYSAPRTWEWAMRNPRPIEEVEDYRFDRETDWQTILLPHIPEGGVPSDIQEPGLRQWIDDMYRTDGSRRFVRRLFRHRPVPTVVTGVAIKGVLRHCHPILNRVSTVREIARYQSFPDAYVLPPNLTLAYRLLGEAIPLGMGSAFARMIAKYAGVSPVPFSSDLGVSNIWTPDTLLAK